MITRTLVFLFLVLCECTESRTILFKDDSKIEMSLPVSINGKNIPRQLRFYSTLSHDEIERRIAKGLSSGSSLEFSTGELYQLSYKFHKDFFLKHQSERNIYIAKPNYHSTLKFLVNHNFHKIVEAKRDENCALNCWKFYLKKKSDLSIKNIYFGLSEPFRMTLNQAEKEGFKLELQVLEVLLVDLNEIFKLLTTLKNEGFEGSLPSHKLDEIVVVGLDGHLKLVVPAVVGTKISDNIAQFTRFLAELFAENAQIFSVFHQKRGS